MEALRLITEPTNRQLVIDLPPSLGHRRLKVIVMPAANIDQTPLVRGGRRKRSALLAATVTLTDDLIAPAVPESGWDALK